jgi:NAD(P)-dependent dehydrogenase (short-subunit alcohol dehydrogenase family)
VILITGAARGLGKACALKLASLGYDLLLHYNTHEKEAKEVASLCKGVRVELIQADFLDLDDFCNKLQNFEIKGLVNNVGNYLDGNVQETSPQQWLELFQTNLHAPFLLIKAVLPKLKKHKGRIINIGVAGLHGKKAVTHATAYSLTKTALEKLTLSLAKELAPVGVTVNMVSPGHMEVSVTLKDEKALPMGRAARFDEVASLIAFLLSPEASYITGQNIEIAGGVSL